MPMITDFALSRYDDATVTVAMVPPVNVSGWALQFKAQNRFGGLSGFMIKSCASGFNNVSGINVTNGAQGIFNVSLNSVESSGLSYGNYAYQVGRTDSGNVNAMAEGYILLLPSVG